MLRLNRMGAANYRFKEFRHQGNDLDIDNPHEVILARQIMHHILGGSIDYPLDEHIHDTDENIGRSTAKVLEHTPHQKEQPAELRTGEACSSLRAARNRREMIMRGFG